ncbi:MAG: FAD-dependent oxidoreductase, partial [Solirubrobacteraceae bacterium]
HSIHKKPSTEHRGKHRWTGGGCSVRWGKDATASEEERMRVARPQRTLFFAGEHCSSTPAWIDGAIESAVLAVRQLVLHDAGPGTAEADELTGVEVAC